MLRIYSVYAVVSVLFLVLVGLLGHKHQLKKPEEAPLLKIAIIDSGFGPIQGSNAFKFLCKSGHFDFTRNKPAVGIDTFGHGAIVTALINEPIKSARKCYLVYKIDFDTDNFYVHLPKAIDKAAKEGAQFVNMSLVTNDQKPPIRDSMLNAAKAGVTFYVAAGNTSSNLNEVCNFYPQCVEGLKDRLVVVGAQMPFTATRVDYSNFGSKVALWHRGDFFNSYGTSFASPRALGATVANILDK